MAKSKDDRVKKKIQESADELKNQQYNRASTMAKRNVPQKSIDLNEKQLRFTTEYLVDLNGKQAAIRAGYSSKTAESQASRLLRNVKVQEAIQEAMDARAERTKITIDQVLAELGRIGFSNIKDFVKFDADGVVRIKDSEELTPEQAACIAEITQSESDKSNNFKFKLCDKLKALELLGRHLKMFTDKVEQTGNITVVMRDYSKEAQKKNG